MTRFKQIRLTFLRKLILKFVTATTITDMYYIAKKDKGHSLAIEFISNLIQFVDLIGILRLFRQTYPILKIQSN